MKLALVLLALCALFALGQPETVETGKSQVESRNRISSLSRVRRAPFFLPIPRWLGSRSSSSSGSRSRSSSHSHESFGRMLNPFNIFGRRHRHHGHRYNYRGAPVLIRPRPNNGQAN